MSRRTDLARSIEARPVTWRGVTYRSTLEARWAVFFDSAGLPYEYEPRTFFDREYPSAGQYTPDFHVTGWSVGDGAWVEIKPPRGSIGYEEIRIAREKCKILSDYAVDGQVLLIQGEPMPGKYDVEIWDCNLHFHGGRLAWCLRCGGAYVVNEEVSRGQRGFIAAGLNGDCTMECPWPTQDWEVPAMQEHFSMAGRASFGGLAP